MEGTIKNVNQEKGFGFISIEGQPKDLFFHSNDLVGVSFAELRIGDKVKFETTDTPKGPAAKNVERV